MPHTAVSRGQLAIALGTSPTESAELHAEIFGCVRSWRGVPISRCTGGDGDTRGYKVVGEVIGRSTSAQCQPVHEVSDHERLTRTHVLCFRS
jgi:hypothetical protein